MCDKCVKFYQTKNRLKGLHAKFELKISKHVASEHGEIHEGNHFNTGLLLVVDTVKGFEIGVFLGNWGIYRRKSFECLLGSYLFSRAQWS